jgi:hypothetical protein
MPRAALPGLQDMQTTQREMSDYYWVPTISTRQRWHRHIFVFLAKRLVLPGQLITLRLHILHLHFIVVLLTVKFRQPSHEFTFGVGMTFVSYSLVLTPVV